MVAAISLFTVGVGVAVLGYLVLMGARHPVQHVEAFILFLTAAVLVGAAAIVDAIRQLRGRAAAPDRESELAPEEPGAPRRR